jgi:hypothetical protein
MFIFFLALSLCKYGNSQNVIHDPVAGFEPVIETMNENQALPEDFADIFDDLNFYRENPLNLNTASREDLEKFVFLTSFQIQSLLEYRKNHGPILTLYELPLIFGFDSITVTYLLPFVMVDEPDTNDLLKFNNILKNGKNELICNFTENCFFTHKNIDSLQTTEPSAKYSGAPYRILLKYRYHYQENIRFGITMEKDAGEDFFRGSNRQGFDFYSGYIQVKNKGFLKSFLIGDYQVNSGQGLTIWSGFSFGKTPYPALIYKRPEPVKPYSSVDENRFLRGIALSCAFHNLTLSAFYSIKSLDANITDTLNSQQYVFSSFQETGYHRTNAEIEDEDAITEQTAGGIMVYQNNRLRIGSSFVHYFFSGYKQKPDDLYKKYEFYGNRLINAGFDYSYTSKKYHLYGETSIGNYALATINGVMLNIHSRVLFSLLQRYYDPEFYSRYSSAISENSRPANENAFYLGTVIHLCPYLKINAYVDFFRFPWLTYLAQKPSSGNETLIQADIEPSGSLSFYLRMQTKTRIINYLSDGENIMRSQSQRSTSVRFQTDFMAGTNLRLRNRLEYKYVDNQFTFDSKGFLIYQDIIFGFPRWPLQGYIRFLMFSSDSYASRIYCYENDLLYAYTAPAFYDEGYRSYFLIHYNATDNLIIRLKLGFTFPDHITGYQSETSNAKKIQEMECKLQLRVLF